MLRLFTPLAAIMASCLGLTAAAAADDDLASEPPLTYTVRVGEKAVRITEGEPTRLSGSFTDPEITVTAAAYRNFAKAGIRFAYPRSFTFEYDGDPAATTWTLSGSNFTVMVMSFPVALSAADFAAGMREQFGNENSEIASEAARLKLGELAMEGTTMRARAAGTTLAIGIYQVPSRRGRSKLLVLQDPLDDAGRPSPESAAAMKMISSSFAVER